MTLIVGVVTENFALMVADTLAQTKGSTTVQVAPRVRLVAAGGVSIMGFEKLTPTAEGKDMIGVAGTVEFHQKYLPDATKRSGLDCDEFLFERMRTLPRFKDFHTLPDDATSPNEACLHIFQQGSRFIMSMLDGSMFHVSRDWRRSYAGGAEALCIGSGSRPMADLLERPPRSETWPALKQSSTSTAGEFTAFLKTLYEEVSASANVGREIVAWSMKPDAKWQRLA